MKQTTQFLKDVMFKMKWISILNKVPMVLTLLLIEKINKGNEHLNSQIKDTFDELSTSMET